MFSLSFCFFSIMQVMQLFYSFLLFTVVLFGGHGEKEIL